MDEKDAVYKTKLAEELFQIGCHYKTGSHPRYYDGKPYLLFVDQDESFALECFHKAILLDPKQKYINRYVALKIRLYCPYFFNKPDDYMPTGGPLVKPEWENEYTAACKAELAKFEIYPSEEDTSE